MFERRSSHTEEERRLNVANKLLNDSKCGVICKALGRVGGRLSGDGVRSQILLHQHSVSVPFSSILRLRKKWPRERGRALFVRDRRWKKGGERGRV